MEQFKQIKNYPDYYIGDKGTLISSRRTNEKVIKPGICQSGYLTAKLYNDEQSRTLSIHRLVAESFLYFDPELNMVVNHKDGNKLNNAVDNLEFVTQKENVQHYWNNKCASA